MNVLSKITLFSFFFFAFAAQVANAGMGLPMLTSPVNSGQEYANRLSAGQCNGSCNLVVEALHHARWVSTPDAMEEAKMFLQNADVRACPVGERSLSAAWGTKLGNVHRPYRVGERCLWDRNTGLVIGSAECGNIDLEPKSSGTSTAQLRGVAGRDGRNGIDGQNGLDGAQGPRGATGAAGRDGYVVTQRVTVREYDQGTEGRMSDKGRVAIAHEVGGVLKTAIITYGVGKVFDRLSQRWVERGVLQSQRGPASVTNITQIAIAGNCNAVFGSSAHCVEQAPPREVIREVPVDRPIYIPVDRPVLVPIAQPPVRTEPGVSPPVFGQPPVRTEPGVSPPVFGDGGRQPGVGGPVFGQPNPIVQPPVRTEPGVGGPIFGDGGGQPTPPPYQPPTPGEPGN